MSRQIRAKAVISGKVQGVCFRAETQQAALLNRVTGWVRNCRNGTVEALFEGDEPAVEAMLKWCRKGAPFSEVHQVDVKREDYIGEFDRFEIVR